MLHRGKKGLCWEREKGLAWLGKGLEGGKGLGEGVAEAQATTLLQETQELGSWWAERPIPGSHLLLLLHLSLKFPVQRQFLERQTLTCTSQPSRPTQALTFDLL